MTTHAQFADLAKLRLGQPADRLAAILGKEWSPPGKADKGRFWLQGPVQGLGASYPFGARFTTAGTIGALSFFATFPAGLDIRGLEIGMPLQAVRKVHPDLVRDSEESSEEYGVDAYRSGSREEDGLIIKIKDGVVLAVIFQQPGAEYPGEIPAVTYPRREGIRAYDLEMLHREVDRTAPDNHGWVFGLPPGITPEQWPLDPISGYPLMHGFTIKLPADYRVHGPEIVALSFFATASDQNDGGARARKALHAAVIGAEERPPADPHLRAFWQHARARHPRLHRMTDILDY
jgi:hypothetical protein